MSATAPTTGCASTAASCAAASSARAATSGSPSAAASSTPCTGGLINTDAIDNSAGVDCSDHEVNIKILLGAAMADGDDDRSSQRNDAAGGDDRRGRRAGARRQPRPDAGARRSPAARRCRWSTCMPATSTCWRPRGGSNRALEFLPTDRQLAERQAAGQGLTTPEFAVLLAYTKNAEHAPRWCATRTARRPVPRRRAGALLPDAAAASGSAPRSRGHRLRREIVATQLVNQMVNLSGISFDHRMTEETGAGVADVDARPGSRRATSSASVDCGSRSTPSAARSSSTSSSSCCSSCGGWSSAACSWLLRHRRPPLDDRHRGRRVPPGDQRAGDDAGRRCSAGGSRAELFADEAGRLAAGVPESARRAVGRCGRCMHTAFDIVDTRRATVASVSPRSAATYWRVFDAARRRAGCGRRSGRCRAATGGRRRPARALRDDLLSRARRARPTTASVRRLGVDGWVAANERAVAARHGDVHRDPPRRHLRPHHADGRPSASCATSP